MTLARDAALAGCVLAVVAVAGAITGTPPVPTAALAGGVGALVVELLASTRAGVIQRHWSRPPVRAAVVAVAVLAVVATAAFAPAVGLNALAGGLVAYLLLVALVAVGIVPPTTAWRID